MENKLNTTEDYAALVRKGLTLIRNLSYAQRGLDLDCQTAKLHLEIIGELSDALHNFPSPNHDNDFIRELTCKKIQDFLRRYPAAGLSR